MVVKTGRERLSASTPSKYLPVILNTIIFLYMYICESTNQAIFCLYPAIMSTTVATLVLYEAYPFYFKLLMNEIKLLYNHDSS